VGEEGRPANMVMMMMMVTIGLSWISCPLGQRFDYNKWIMPILSLPPLMQ